MNNDHEYVDGSDVTVLVKAVSGSWLAGYGARPEKSWLDRCRMATRVALRSVISPNQVTSWLIWLRSRNLSGLLGVNPLLPIKPMRPYLAADWDIARRIEVLKATIEFMGLRAQPCSDLLAGKSVVLAAFDLPELTGVTVRLVSCPSKEGELTLSVHTAGFPGYVARAIFSIERRSADSFAMRVGCVQGNQRAYEVDRRMEKAMHGLRPKAFVVFLLQALANGLGIEAIFGINKSRHVFLYKRALARKLGRDVRTLVFDYDAMWEELGGVRQADGWYQLPITAQRRDYADIKPNKRSMYRKRYALMDEITAQIHLACGAMPASLESPVPAESAIH